MLMYAEMISAAPEGSKGQIQTDRDDMCFGGQGIHKERRKEALGAGSVEELGCTTSKLTCEEYHSDSGLKCGSDLGEASKGPKTMIVRSFCYRQSRSRIKQTLSPVT